MIYSVTGRLIHTDAELAVVECAGVGYACRTSLSTLQKIAGREEVTLLTHLSVREDGVELFGFADEEELRSFRLLISVSGVGPKAAIAILSTAVRFSGSDGGFQELHSGEGHRQKDSRALMP